MHLVIANLLLVVYGSWLSSTRDEHISISAQPWGSMRVPCIICAIHKFKDAQSMAVHQIAMTSNCFS